MKRLAKIALLLLIALPAVQAQSLNDAYVNIKKKSFKKDYNYLAVMPVVSAPAVALPEATRKVIVDEVIKKFTKSRFKLILPQEVALIENQFTVLYPVSMRKERTAIVSEHTLRELFFRYPVDGVISVQVLAVAAPFAKDTAQWGGTSQKIKHRGDGLFGSIMGKDYGGYIAASEIRVVISDRTGKPVYKWAGGIEVMMERNGKKFEEISKENLWQKPKRVLKAVKYALKPI